MIVLEAAPDFNFRRQIVAQGSMPFCEEIYRKFYSNWKNVFWRYYSDHGDILPEYGKRLFPCDGDFYFGWDVRKTEPDCPVLGF